jgi:hypothetical protein
VSTVVVVSGTLVVVSGSVVEVSGTVVDVSGTVVDVSGTVVLVSVGAVVVVDDSVVEVEDDVDDDVVVAVLGRASARTKKGFVSAGLKWEVAQWPPLYVTMPSSAGQFAANSLL